MREQAYVKVQMTPSPTVMAPSFVNKGRRVDVDEKGTFPELS